MSDPTELVVHRDDPLLDAAVVFVHGYGGKPDKTWGDFPSMVANEPLLANRNVYSLGYSTRMAPEVRGGWTDSPRIASSAELFRTALRFDARLARSAGAGKLAIIAHSMGGLVVQRAILDSVEAGDGVAERVGHLVMFGSPSGGLTRARKFRWFNRQIGDMADDGPFITSLRAQWTERLTPPPFVLMAGAGDEDAFVPPEASLDPFPASQRFVVPGDHLDIVKPAGPASISFSVVVRTIGGDPSPAGPLNAARVMVEAKDYQSAIDVYAAQDRLDDRDAVSYALALEGAGRPADALEVLADRGTTHALGGIAGRLKRRWWSTGDDAAADRALDLYSQGLEMAAGAPTDHEEAYYHAINVAYLEHDHRENPEAAGVAAKRAILHAEQSGSTYWQAATIGEARLILGDIEDAERWYRRALEHGAKPRQVEQTALQAERIVLGRYANNVIERIDSLFA